MKAILLIDNFISNVVLTWWTPVFVGLFVVVLLFALWPSNKESFDEAARIPLRKD
jgi:cytochrome c oxidase cbb3-type subunit 4